MADLEDPPRPGSIFLQAGCFDKDLARLRTGAKRAILHGSIVVFLWFHIFFGFFVIRGLRSCYSYSNRWEYPNNDGAIAFEIVTYGAIACLYILAPSRRAEKLVSVVFLGSLFLIVLFVSISNEGIKVEFVFAANIVALSLYCIWKLYPIVLPWLNDYWIRKVHPVSQPWLQYLPAIAPAWEEDEEGTTGRLLPRHAAAAAAFRIQDLPREFSYGEFVFAANIVALSLYCIWKLYPIVLPWLNDYWIRKVHPVAQPWLQYLPAIAPAWEEDEEGTTGRLLPRHAAAAAAFRIQDLPREFSYGEVRAMTQDFRTMVGEGGFAQVFRGLLDDGSTAVAVKRITVTGDGAVGGEDDFLREISIVANVHHRSLVRLLGYCLPRGAGGSSRYLVYPFFENGSLDSWLFHGGDERRSLLPWPARRCIAIDVAKALAYLHHECRQQILHLDIKPGNILLDAGLRACVSDFGISMSVTRDLSRVDTRGRGTPGYMAPEMMINAVSTKSDVFSYGMTLLELVGGRRNFDLDDSSATPDLARDFFPYVVREKLARGKLMEAVDSAMALVDQEEVEAAVKVALCCIESRWDMRPSMLTVVDMLEGRVAADLPSESRRLMSSVNFSGPLSSSLTHELNTHALSACQIIQNRETIRVGLSGKVTGGDSE
ncbi:hypothetical protein U9M48_018546 [Paspalum notatum var. saurae]|uniref:Protein kinase domain-containing protein n=1 Tax=Paspalum notatum var. saurae TaxID=547442 RepID=A0AAQ3TD47_PASNO